MTSTRQEERAFYVTQIGWRALHIIITTGALIPIIRLSRSLRTEADRKLLPCIYVTLLFSHVPILAIHNALFSTVSLPYEIIGRVYLFALYFVSLLFCLSGLFHLGINQSKIFPFIAWGGAFALFLSLITPLSISAHPLTPLVWGPRYVYLFLILCSVLGVLNSLFVFVKEKTHTNLLYGGGYILIIVGNTILFLVEHPLFLFIGTLMYTFGLILGSPRRKISYL